MSTASTLVKLTWFLGAHSLEHWSTLLVVQFDMIKEWQQAVMKEQHSKGVKLVSKLLGAHSLEHWSMPLLFNLI